VIPSHGVLRCIVAMSDSPRVNLVAADWL